MFLPHVSKFVVVTTSIFFDTRRGTWSFSVTTSSFSLSLFVLEQNGSYAELDCSMIAPSDTKTKRGRLFPRASRRQHETYTQRPERCFCECLAGQDRR